MSSSHSPIDSAVVPPPVAAAPAEILTPPVFAISAMLEPQYLLIVLSSLAIIWIGAHASLRRPPSAAPAKRKKGEKQREEEKFVEGLVASDAIRFPILLAAVLVGLYYLIQWLQDPAIVNKILRGYMSLMSVAGLSSLSGDALEILTSLVFPSMWADSNGRVYRVDSDRRRQYTIDPETGEETVVKGNDSPLPGRLAVLASSEGVRRSLWQLRQSLTREWDVRIGLLGETVAELDFRVTDLFRFAIAGAVAAAYHWVEDHAVSNLLSAAMCYSTFLVFTPTSFTVGTLLLVSLFVYDVVMVFYTPFMITVAKKIDAPIKLVFKSDKGASMLGLGDIIIPGILIALALRFDLYMYYQRKIKLESVELTTETTTTAASSSPGTTKSTTPSTRRIKAPYIPSRRQWGNRFWTTPLGRLSPLASEPAAATAFPKPYFYASLAGYAAGMLVTMAVMLAFRHGQPALLYLVPGVTGAVWLTGLVRGEVGEMWAYTEDGSLDTEDVVVDVEVEVEVGGGGKETEGGEEGKQGEGKDKREGKRGKGGGEGDQGNGDGVQDGREVEDKDGKEGRPYELFGFSITAPVTTAAS